MTQKTLFAAALVAIIAASPGAFARNDIGFSQDGRLAFAAPHAATAAARHYVKKPESATIFSNLASAYPNGLYFSGEGETIYASGADSQFVAGGFTPTASATAVEVQVAVGEFGDGKSSYTLSINADASGVPGAVLASTMVTSAAPFGACCGLVTGKFKSGVALTAGKPYWVAVTLDKKQLKAGNDGAWNLATTDQVDTAPFAYNPNNTGWVAFPTILPPAFGVFSE
jgi:hypothetical protein